MTCTPYPPARWEFAVVADRLAPESSVVDLGCGDGAFLQSIRSRVARVAGIDHNPDGIARLARAGIEAEVRDFRSFADREAGAFDVACSFHTLEHLPRVDGLIEAAATCVRPSGRIFVSVPNRDRFGREELEPMDCPPHHMSRWSREQLPLIADRFGLELVAVRVEEPDLSHARKAYRPKSLPALGDHDPLGRVVTAMRLSSRRYARLAHEAAFTARGLFGHGILAEFRRPR